MTDATAPSVREPSLPGSSPRATTNASRPPLSMWQQASYGAPALPLALAGIPIALYLPAIYTSGFGLELGLLSIVLVLQRLVRASGSRETR